jgi:hypothetical protein
MIWLIDHICKEDMQKSQTEKTDWDENLSGFVVRLLRYVLHIQALVFKAKNSVTLI